MLMVILRVPRRSPRGTLGAPRMLNLPVGPAVDFLLMTATVTFLPTRLAPLEGPPFLPLGDASCAFLALADAVFCAAADIPRFLASTAPRLAVDLAVSALTLAFLAAAFLGAFLGAFFGAFLGCVGGSEGG